VSFQAYLDAVEKKTGKTPQQLVDEAHAKGFGPDTKAGEIVAWLADDYGLGRGHAMALVHVIRNGPGISEKHVGSTGVYRDPSSTLTLDGNASGHPGSAQKPGRAGFNSQHFGCAPLKCRLVVASGLPPEFARIAPTTHSASATS